MLWGCLVDIEGSTACRFSDRMQDAKNVGDIFFTEIGSTSLAKASRVDDKLGSLSTVSV